jgi:hypothetical protein
LPERDPESAGGNTMALRRLLFFRVCFLPEAFFFATLFGTGFFFASFLGRFTVFRGVGRLRAVFFDLVALFRAFFLVAIRAV